MVWSRHPRGKWVALAAALLLAGGCTPPPPSTTEVTPEQTSSDDLVKEQLFLGDQYRNSGLPQKAVEAYEKALNMDPGNPDIYPRLGYALIETKDFARATRIYQRYVELRPDDCNSHASLGFAYLRQDMADQAVVRYEKALELCPDDPNAFTNLGKAYLAGGYAIEGIEAFRRALELNPADAVAYENLARLFWERNLYPEAIAMYEGILAMPDHGKDGEWILWASGRLAYAYKWAGAFEKAIPHYRRVIDSDPENLSAIRGLASCYEETSQIDLAIRLYRDLIKQKPDTPGYYYRLGELLNDVGRYRETIEVVKEGQKIDEECPAHGLCVLGRAYEKLGGIPNYKRAKREFKKARDCRDARFTEYAGKQMERQDQLIKIEELKRKKAEYGG
jgi:tetratricopeptide (TPR) repeat protein